MIRSKFFKSVIIIVIIAAVAASALMVVFGAINVANINDKFSSGDKIDITTDDVQADVGKGESLANATGATAPAYTGATHQKLRHARYYFETPSINTEYMLAGNGYQGGSGAGLYADYFGNIFPGSSSNEPRRSPDGGGNGFKVSNASTMDGAYFFTNIKISPDMVKMAKSNNLFVQIGFQTNNWTGDTYYKIGMKNTSNILPGFGAGDDVNSGGGWGSLSEYNNTSFSSGNVDWSQQFTIGYAANAVSRLTDVYPVASTNIDNGGIRIKISMSHASGDRMDHMINNLTVKFTKVFEGGGSAADPFLIRNSADLTALSNYVNGGRNGYGVYFKQTSNIDMNGVAFTPIGKINSYSSQTPQGRQFDGTYDGDNKLIHNLRMENASAIGQALFGWTDVNATIKNVNLSSGLIEGSYLTGSLVGFSSGNIINCHNTGVWVNSHGTGGGLVGFLASGRTIERSSNRAPVKVSGSVTTGIAMPGGESDNYQIGGIVGVSNGTIKFTYNSGDITVDSGGHKGGIVGWLMSNGRIENCYNLGNVSGNRDRSSGITARNMAAASNVANCFNRGTITDLYPGQITGSGYGNGDTNCFDSSASTYTSGEMAYRLNGSTANLKNWTQGASYPQFSDGNNATVMVTLTQATGGTISFPGVSLISGTTVYANAGRSINLANSPNANYDFINYLINGASSTAATFTVPKTNTTVSAAFKAYYYIKFHSNNGGSAENSTKYYIGDSVTMPANSYTYNGMNFDSWNTNANNSINDTSGTKYIPNSSYNFSAAAGATVNIYAIWKIGNHSVTNINNYISDYNTSGYRLETIASHASDANIEYTYQWYRGGVLISGQNTNTLIMINVADSGIYYCIVTAKDTVRGDVRTAQTNSATITITGLISTSVVNGTGNIAHGTSSVGMAAAAGGVNVGLTIAANAHYYIFAIYWNDSNNIAINDYSNFKMPANVNIVDIKVEFSPIEYKNISFAINHSDSMNQMPYNFDSSSLLYTIESPSFSFVAPTRSCYAFYGWFLSREGSGDFAEDYLFSDAVEVDVSGTYTYLVDIADFGKDIEFFAQWTPITYNIQYFFGDDVNKEILSLNLTSENVGLEMMPVAVTIEKYNEAFVAASNLVSGHSVFNQIEDVASKITGLNSVINNLGISNMSLAEFAAATTVDSTDFKVYITSNVELFVSQTTFNYLNSDTAAVVKILEFTKSGENYNLNYSKAVLANMAKTQALIINADYNTALSSYGLELFYKNNLISAFYGAGGSNIVSLASFTKAELGANRVISIVGNYARYSVSYTDTFDNTAIGGIGQQYSTYNIESNFTLPLPSARVGFTFESYYIDNSLNVAYPGSIILGSTGNLKLYAHWSLNAPTFVYDNKTKDPSSGYYEYGITYNNPSKLTITGEGYSLASEITYTYQWQYSEDGVSFSNLDSATLNSITVGEGNVGSYYYRVVVVASTKNAKYTSQPSNSDVARLTIAVKLFTASFVFGVDANYIYTGKAIQPLFIVKDGGIELTASDYSFVFGDNINAAKNGGTIVISGVPGGNYDGTITITFNILQKGITIVFSGNTGLIYNGNVQKITAMPVGYVEGESAPLLNTDYNTPAINAGNYTATVTLFDAAKSNYKLISANGADIDSYIGNFSISPKELDIVFSEYDNIAYFGANSNIACNVADIREVCFQGGVQDIVNIILTYNTEDRANVGTYMATASFTNANYTIKATTTNSQQYIVVPKTINIDGASYFKRFGDNDPAFRLEVDSGIQKDGILFVTVLRDTTSANFWDYEAIGTYNFDTLSHDYTNFNIVLDNPCTLEITINDKLTVKPTLVKKTYGDQDPAITTTIQGAFGLTITVTFTRSPGENYGYYNLSTEFAYTWDASISADCNQYYVINPTNIGDYNSKFYIDARPINVTIKNQSKTYGDQDPQFFEYIIDSTNIPELDGGAAADINKIFQSATVSRERGEDYRANGYRFSFDIKNKNYSAVVNDDARFIINKRQINILSENIILTTKVYDGYNTALATLGLTDLEQALLISSGFAINAAYVSTDVGENIGINVSYSVNAREKNNFILPQNYQISGDIQKRTLNVTIDNIEMVYGSQLPTMTINLDNFIAGENQTNAGISQFPTVNYGDLNERSNTGTYEVTLVDGVAGNYNFNITDTAVITVVAAPLTLTAGEEFVRRIDGTTNAAITDKNYILNGLKDWDKQNFVLYFTAELESGAQGKTRVIMIINATNNFNYDLQTTILYIPAEVLPLPIINVINGEFTYDGTQKTLIIKATVKNEVYTNFTVTYTKIGGEEVADAPINAGTYQVRAIPNEIEYINAAATGVLIINKLKPIITITGSLEQVYGDFKNLTAKATGVNLNQNLNVNYEFGSSNNPDVGNYEISISYDGAENYESISETTILKITKKDIVIAFADYENLTYNGALQYPRVGFIGVVGNDTIDVTLQYLDDKEPKNAGSYSLTAHIDDDNYNITNSATLSYAIAKKDLYVNIAEGGTATPNKINVDITFEGFVDGESKEALIKIPTPQFIDKKVGNVSIKLAGGEDSNYNFIYPTNPPQVTLTYNPQKNAALSQNAIYIVIGSIVLVAALIGILAYYNKKKIVKSFIAEQAAKY